MELRELVERLHTLPYHANLHKDITVEEVLEDIVYIQFIIDNIEVIKEYLWQYHELSK